LNLIRGFKSTSRKEKMMRTRNTMLPVSGFLKIVGFGGAALGIATVFFSTAVYVQNHSFSVFTTYLSDIGDTPGWPQIIFNTGMLIIAPVRYLFLILLILRLRDLGAGRLFGVLAFGIGTLVVIGSIGMSAIPYSLQPPLHKSSAMLYFFGVVILQTVIGVQELRRRLPFVLPVSSLAVVGIYFVFAFLFASIGKIEGITRETPVIWEWLAFASLIFWLIAHSIVLGRKFEAIGSVALKKEAAGLNGPSAQQ
jgi:hypothetical membrane protein